MPKADKPDSEHYELVADSVRIFQRGAVWHANFQRNGKQCRKSLDTTSKKEARRKAVGLAAELIEGRYQDRPKPPSADTVIEAYMRYLHTEGRSEKTLVKYKKTFERLSALLTGRHATTILDLDLRAIDAYRHERVAAKAAPKTVYNESVIVRQLVNFALTRGLIVDDPLKGLKIKEPRPTKQPCWTHDEVTKILAESPDDIKAALTLLAETGMRCGELQWLTWDDVNLKSNFLHIRAKDSWKPKTGDERAVPLSPQALAVLEALPRGHRWVVTMPPSASYRRSDRQWTERRLLGALKRVLKKLDLPGKLHTFRHYFISNALMTGAAESTVRAWVGHVDAETIKLYTHVHNEASQAAMQRLAEANRAPQPNRHLSQDAGCDPAQIQHTRQEPSKARGAK